MLSIKSITILHFSSLIILELYLRHFQFFSYLVK